MNHKTMFFISLVVIAVGIVGMIVRSGDAPDVKEAPPQTADSPRSQQKTITLATARVDLPSGHVLGAEDYEINEITVDEKSDLVRLDVSSLNADSLRGFLLNGSVKAGSYLPAPMLESPNTVGFALNSLRSNETIYQYPVKAVNGYLLDSIRGGDKVSLYLRMLEVPKDKRIKSNVGVVSSTDAGGKSGKYVLSRLISPLTVLKVQRREASQSDDVVGYLQLKANTHDLELIYTVEKVGDLLILPVGGGTETGKIELDSLLPQLKTIKEIRG